MKLSLKEIEDIELNRLYLEIMGDAFEPVLQITVDPHGPVQYSLDKLDEEAEKLEAEAEDITPTNEALTGAMSTYSNILLGGMTTAMVLKASAIQASGAEVAKVMVPVKTFQTVSIPLLTGQAFQQVYDPLMEGLKNSGVAWNGVDVAVADKVKGYVTSDAWKERMNNWGPGYAAKTETVIRQGIDSGWSPKRVAQEMRLHAEGIPISAAENLTRTLQLTAYRDASAMNALQNNEFIDYKVRVATMDDRTCLSCIGLHGTIMKLNEVVRDHYRGRCSEWYKVAGGPDFPDFMQSDSKPGQRNFVPFQNGQEWFDGLPPERQAMQNSFKRSPAKYKAFKDGVPLSKFTVTHVDSVFGEQLTEGSLIKVVGSDLADKYKVRDK